MRLFIRCPKMTAAGSSTGDVVAHVPGAAEPCSAEPSMPTLSQQQLDEEVHRARELIVQQRLAELRVDACRPTLRKEDRHRLHG